MNRFFADFAAYALANVHADKATSEVSNGGVTVSVSNDRGGRTAGGGAEIGFGNASIKFEYLYMRTFDKTRNRSHRAGDLERACEYGEGRFELPLRRRPGRCALLSDVIELSRSSRPISMWRDARCRATKLMRTRSRASRRPLELDVALLQDARLLDRDHLPLELSQLGRHGAVATHKKRRRPEHNDRNTGRDLIIGSFLILRPTPARRARKERKGARLPVRSKKTLTQSQLTPKQTSP
ncbi:MAG: hypothetical protein K2Y71_14220 [Xanthobacteraceae bacterium]|nr:hypothetical protein [Xanthobacteraceae bacterium]